MSVVLYLCEASGARIIATNSGLTQTGTDFQGDVTTWDLAPMGEVGDVLWRTVDVSGTMTNGLSLGVTPIVDGVSLSEQTFSKAGSGEWQCQAFFATRGTRLAARIRTLARTGDVEIHNISCAYVGIRRVP